MQTCLFVGGRSIDIKDTTRVIGTQKRLNKWTNRRDTWEVNDDATNRNVQRNQCSCWVCEDYTDLFVGMRLLRGHRLILCGIITEQ